MGEREKAELEELLGPLVKVDGRIHAVRAKELAKFTAHCQVVRGPKKAFVNLALRAEAKGQLENLLIAALDREGKRQYDPPMLKPIHRDLNLALQKGKQKREDRRA